MSHPRKYDPALLLQLAAQPKSKGGRPKKFATPEQKRAADAEYHRIARQRRKLISEGKEIPEDLQPKRQRYATDEERHQARKQQGLNAYYRTHDAHKLNLVVSIMRKKLAN